MQNQVVECAKNVKKCLLEHIVYGGIWYILEQGPGSHGGIWYILEQGPCSHGGFSYILEQGPGSHGSGIVGGSSVIK